MSNIAGHTFLLDDVCVCGRRWLQIMDADESCVGQKGYAHVGELNGAELGEIRAERARRRQLVAEAMGEMSR